MNARGLAAARPLVRSASCLWLRHATRHASTSAASAGRRRSGLRTGVTVAAGVCAVPLLATAAALACPYTVAARKLREAGVTAESVRGTVSFARPRSPGARASGGDGGAGRGDSGTTQWPSLVYTVTARGVRWVDEDGSDVTVDTAVASVRIVEQAKLLARALFGAAGGAPRCVCTLDAVSVSGVRGVVGVRKDDDGEASGQVSALGLVSPPPKVVCRITELDVASVDLGLFSTAGARTAGPNGGDAATGDAAASERVPLRVRIDQATFEHVDCHRVAVCSVLGACTGCEGTMDGAPFFGASHLPTNGAFSWRVEGMGLHAKRLAAAGFLDSRLVSVHAWCAAFHCRRNAHPSVTLLRCALLHTTSCASRWRRCVLGPTYTWLGEGPPRRMSRNTTPAQDPCWAWAHG